MQLPLVGLEDSPIAEQSKSPPEETENSEAGQRAKHNEWSKAWYRKNRAAISARRKNQRTNNPEIVRAKENSQYKAYRESLGFTVKEVRKKGTRTPEIIKQQSDAAQKRYRERHRETLRFRTRERHRARKAAAKLGDGSEYRKMVEARAAYDRIYREKHRERRKRYNQDPERRARWRILNRERYRRLLARPRKKRTPEEIQAADRASWNKYRAKKAKDPFWRLLSSVRTMVGRLLSGATKCGKSMELIGCTTAELRAHIESQFQPGMTWDTYGFYGWHADHKRPVSSFDLSDPAQQRECFSYKNLQPLWAVQNLKKGARLSFPLPTVAPVS